MRLLRNEPVYPDAKNATTFRDGVEFQDWVCERLARHGVILQNLASKRWQLQVGENLQGFEIKLDRRCSDTLRLSIEIAERSRNDPSLGWTDSGIYRSDNSWLYVQGNETILFIFARQFLRNYHASTSPRVVEHFGTVRAFYLPFGIAMRHAAKVLRFPSAGEVA
jgi:hypothetical protein